MGGAGGVVRRGYRPQVSCVHVEGRTGRSERPLSDSRLQGPRATGLPPPRDQKKERLRVVSNERGEHVGTRKRKRKTTPTRVGRAHLPVAGGARGTHARPCRSGTGCCSAGAAGVSPRLKGRGLGV